MVMMSGSGSLKDTSARLWQCWAQTQRMAAASSSPSAAVQTRRMPSWAARSWVPLPGPSPIPGTADSGAGLVTHGRVFPAASCSSLSSSPLVPASSGCGANSLPAICLDAEDKLPAVLASPSQAVVAAMLPRWVRTCRAEGDAVTCKEAFKMVPLSVLPFGSKNMPKCAVREAKRGLIEFFLPTSWNTSTLFLMPLYPSGFILTLLYSLFTQLLLENEADATLLDPHQNCRGGTRHASWSQEQK